MACFHCECKRPADQFIESEMPERQHGQQMRLEKTACRPEFSNAWNFNFDDDESDGADVAAFEYADSPVRGEDLPLTHEGNFRGSEDDFNNASRDTRTHQREYSDLNNNRPGIGFDDFEDEDDVDSYEIDTPNNHSVRKASSNDFSEVERSSEEVDRGFDNNYISRHRASSPSCGRPSKPTRRKSTLSGSEDDELGFDTDEDVSVHPNWKSSHVADSRHRSRDRGPNGPSRGLSFGSDEEFDLHSDLDDDSGKDFRSKRTKGNKPVSSRNSQRRASPDMEDDSFSDSESDIDDLRSHRNKSGGNKTESRRKGNNFKSWGDYRFVRNSPNDGNRSSQRSRRDDDEWEKKDRRSDSRSFRGPKQERYGSPRRGRSYKSNMDAGGDSGEFRNSRRIIER